MDNIEQGSILRSLDWFLPERSWMSVLTYMNLHVESYKSNRIKLISMIFGKYIQTSVLMSLQGSNSSLLRRTLVFFTSPPTREFPKRHLRREEKDQNEDSLLKTGAIIIFEATYGPTIYWIWEAVSMKQEFSNIQPVFLYNDHSKKVLCFLLKIWLAPEWKK